VPYSIRGYAAHSSRAMGWLQLAAVHSEKRNKNTTCQWVLRIEDRVVEIGTRCSLLSASFGTSTAAPNKPQNFPTRIVSSSLCSPIIIHTERYHLPVLCACLCLITLSKMHIALSVWNHTICTTIFHSAPHSCIYVFCVDLRTNSDYFPIQH